MNYIALTVEMRDGGKMFASFLDAGHVFADQSCAHCEWGSHTNSSGPTSGDVQQAGVDVDDLWLAVPVGGNGLPHMVLFEPDQTVDPVQSGAFRTEGPESSVPDRPATSGTPLRYRDRGIEGGRIKKVAPILFTLAGDRIPVDTSCRAARGG